MNENYLGDSYDLVKRFFCQVLGTIAPLYAHSQFVPSTIREAYLAITTIPFLEGQPDGSFGILLDPDTGISVGGATKKHASLPFIVEINQQLSPSYMICFDQSFHRKKEPNKEQQMDVKRKFLLDHGLRSFYYDSHAPFLFIAQSPETLVLIRNRLASAGIPNKRFAPS